MRTYTVGGTDEVNPVRFSVPVLPFATPDTVVTSISGLPTCLTVHVPS